MAKKKYELPVFLVGVCASVVYEKWLHNRAKAHVTRDRERGYRDCRIERYKQMIHAAVCNGGDRDYYTGLPLDWSLIGTYCNQKSSSGRGEYFRSYRNMPTVDHAVGSIGELKFVICS